MVSTCIQATVVFGLFHLSARGDRAYEYIYEFAGEAVQKYEKEGVRALQRNLDEAFNRHGVSGFLLHGDGRAISREPPKFARENITRYPQTIRNLETPHGSITLRSISVTTEQGDSYRLIAFIRSNNEHIWSLENPQTRFISPILIFVLASFLISLLITRPLAGLKKATQKFALGDLSARAPKKIAKRNDAFGELAQEFDQMGSRVEILVDEHKRLLRDVSHELRSPLSRMQVAATLLEDKLDDDSLAKSQVARIQSEIIRLDNMVAQLLSLTRIQSGAVKLDKREVELKTLLEGIVQDAAYEFSDKHAKIIFVGESLTLLADAEKLRSVFENIIRNGLRYANATLDVALSREASTARIEITDDGAGVEEQSLENIFEPFFRPDDSRTESTGNFGIGLAIAKSITLVHQGTIFAANTSQGGLKVTVELPIVSKPAKQSA